MAGSLSSPVACGHAGHDIAAQSAAGPPYSVTFVLGGPGSGKGTQCARLVDELGFVHLSAGDLLRELVRSGSEEGEEVARMIREGVIVPSSITIGLLLKAMHKKDAERTAGGAGAGAGAGPPVEGPLRFLVDGFPRNMENMEDWVRMAGFDCAMVLFFDCPEEEMERRLLARGQHSGRSDDNIESIRKRFRTYRDSTMRVLEHYQRLGKLRRVDATGEQCEVAERVRAIATVVCPPSVCVRVCVCPLQSWSVSRPRRTRTHWSSATRRMMPSRTTRRCMPSS